MGFPFGFPLNRGGPSGQGLYRSPGSDVKYPESKVARVRQVSDRKPGEIRISHGYKSVFSGL